MEKLRDGEAPRIACWEAISIAKPERQVKDPEP